MSYSYGLALHDIAQAILKILDEHRECLLTDYDNTVPISLHDLPADASTELQVAVADRRTAELLLAYEMKLKQKLQKYRAGDVEAVQLRHVEGAYTALVQRLD